MSEDATQLSRTDMYIDLKNSKHRGEKMQLEIDSKCKRFGTFVKYSKILRKSYISTMYSNKQTFSCRFIKSPK